MQSSKHQGIAIRTDSFQSASAPAVVPVWSFAFLEATLKGHVV